MSGVNKKIKHIVFGKSFYFVTMIYLLVVGGLALGAYFLPNIYSSIDEKRVVATRDELDQLIETKTDYLEEELQKFADSKHVELAVISQEGFRFTTIPTTDFSVLDDWVDPASLSYRSSYTVEIGKTTYQVWLAIYQMAPQSFFEMSIVFLIAGVFLLFTIVVLLIIILFRKIVEPLRRLRDNIFKLKQYKLSEIHTANKQTEYDVLSEELSEFTDDLQGKMDTIGVKYTALEKELQERQEKSIYKDQLVGSLIHDLKTPVSMVNLQLEKLKEDFEHVPTLANEIQKIEKQNQKIVKEIKEAVQMIHEEQIISSPEQVNIVKELQDTIKRFKPILKKRKIHCVIDVPATLFIKIDLIEMRQLLHNIVSNVSQYTDELGVFELTVYQENQSLIMCSYNESSQLDTIDFEHIFDLFYQGSATDATAGNGVGMYTIKSMVQKHGGNCHFIPKKQGVELFIEIPLKEEDDEQV